MFFLLFVNSNNEYFTVDCFFFHFDLQYYYLFFQVVCMLMILQYFQEIKEKNVHRYAVSEEKRVR